MQAAAAYIGSCKYHAYNTASQAGHAAHKWSVAFLATGIKSAEGAVKTLKLDIAIINITLNVFKESYDAYGYTGPTTVLLQQLRPFVTIGEVIFDFQKRVLPWVRGDVPRTRWGFVALVSVTAYRAIGFVQFLIKIEMVDLSRIFAAAGKVPVLGTIVLLPVKLVADVINVVGLLADIAAQTGEISRNKAANNAKLEVYQKAHRMWELQMEMFQRVKLGAAIPATIRLKHEELRAELNILIRTIDQNYETTLAARIQGDPARGDELVSDAIVSGTIPVQRLYPVRAGQGAFAGNPIVDRDGHNHRVPGLFRRDIVRAMNDPDTVPFTLPVAILRPDNQAFTPVQNDQARVIYDLKFGSPNAIDPQAYDALENLVLKTGAVWDVWAGQLADQRTNPNDLNKMEKALAFETRKWEVMIDNAKGVANQPWARIASDMAIIGMTVLGYATPAIATFFGIALVSTSLPMLVLGAITAYLGHRKIMITEFGGQVPMIQGNETRDLERGHKLLIPTPPPPQNGGHHHAHGGQQQPQGGQQQPQGGQQQPQGGQQQPQGGQQQPQGGQQQAQDGQQPQGGQQQQNNGNAEV